jgi:predicted benzoate:H+ symporter BenE
VVGFLIIALAITVSWAGSNWLKRALSHIPKALLLALVASVLLSLSFTSSLFLTLALTPLLTTFFAWNEIQASSFGQVRTCLILIVVTVSSLGLGELLDLWVLPSARY